ncbi:MULTISPECIES: 50S ribosomal protein L25/general stress protein Ctc [unclassified Agreia]|uniref:50S ribosomal protein L25/general stress protein Ctc n=1 Tax=unclassified Agreia TaxID=2641148 RepID=UPI0006F5ABF2|nr:MULTISPECIES: 50S ribosomal protein L25/general stress protein Ctc [Microbacteriaceae]KQM57996.1 50S ribosomal protein L25 [Agreia sp. Leaf210]KQR22498.1 50S ribosomal protein L25 [Agreia sp. Leaf335]PPF65414.1 50S ribosomal protein L25 [Clavibacter michiganensis]
MADKKDAQNDNNVVAEVRTSFGKGAARKIRAVGKIPAVLYGHGTEPVHITLPGHQVALILRKANAVLDLDIEGTEQAALVKDVQKDPVLQIIEHIDLIVLRKGEKVQVEVPIHVEGESFAGTLASLDENTLLVEVLAISIPERIVVDIEGAVEGTQILAKDVVLPEGATLVSDPELLVINVTVPEEADLGDSLSAGDEATGSPEAAE